MNLTIRLMQELYNSDLLVIQYTKHWAGNFWERNASHVRLFQGCAKAFADRDTL